VITVYDAAAWMQRCDELAAQANKSCGLVWEIFQRTFTRAINNEITSFDERGRTAALAVAKEFGWATEEELAASKREMDAAGCCIHGLDPYHCPVGCGDLDYEAMDDDWDLDENEDKS